MSLSAKEGVQFAVISPGGFHLLAALDAASAKLGLDLVITSGTDGEHSGPNDPHHLGKAYDVRSQGFSETVKQSVLAGVMGELGTPVVQDGGYVTEKFFGWLEVEDTFNEHFHFQQRHGVEYP